MRRTAASLLLLTVGIARAAEPVDAPRPPAEEVAHRTHPRLDLADWLRKEVGLAPRAETEPGSGALRWSLLPFVVANPLIGAGAGAAVVGSFRTGRSTSTSWSSFSLSGIVTTNAQSSLNVRSDVWLPDDDWVLVGDWAVSHFPGPAWGLGGATPDSNRTIVDRRELKFHETAYRRLAARLYAGAGYFLDDDFDIRDERAAGGEATAFSAYGIGTSGRSVSSGLTASLLWDSRDNPLSPWRGLYGLVRYRWEPDEFGTERTWQSLWLEGRAYLPTGRRGDTVALWAFGWASFGRTPYLMLPSIGDDPEMRSGRGYVEGRHVGRDLVGAEAEWRFALWEFVGATLGANVHSVSDRDALEGVPAFNHWHPAAVAGIRLTIDRRSLANVAIDLAVRPGGVAAYLNFNEAF